VATLALKIGMMNDLEHAEIAALERLVGDTAVDAKTVRDAWMGWFAAITRSEMKGLSLAGSARFEHLVRFAEPLRGSLSSFLVV
jgi:hypothetical protein